MIEEAQVGTCISPGITNNKNPARRILRFNNDLETMSEAVLPSANRNTS